jgi:hypothetical protein
MMEDANQIRIELSELPYFERLRVWPEFTLAKKLTLRWGNATATEKHLQDLPASMMADGNFTQLQQFRRTYHNPGWNLHQHWGSPQLSVAHLNCELLRDKVYAILTVMPLSGIRPDYDKPLEEVWMDILWHGAQWYAYDELEFAMTATWWRTQVHNSG